MDRGCGQWYVGVELECSGEGWSWNAVVRGHLSFAYREQSRRGGV